ncbi:MAG: hypothetical protein J0H43_10380, partial [Actinobacteria bacterium]|nr:hypothetical protein [Actinomycetota bacterium]
MLLATALFSFAVVTGALLLLFIQRYALTHVLDQDASRAAAQAAASASVSGVYPKYLNVSAPGITGIQVVDHRDRVLTSGGNIDRSQSEVDPDELASIRTGDRPTVVLYTGGVQVDLRVFGLNQGSNTILVYTDVSRVNDSVSL